MFSYNRTNPFTRRTTVVGAVLSIFVLILSACGGGEETLSPEAQFTAAAQTAAAIPIQTTPATPTSDPASMVATMAAPSPSPTVQPTTAVITPTLAATTAAVNPPAGGGAQTGAGPDNATYVADVTVQDDEVMTPGEIFDKTWRIKNSGTTTWTTDYSLTYIDGELMGAPNQVPIPNEVSPGEDVEITVEMSAPETAGSYISYWKMTNASGQLFGFGTAGNEAIWVKIKVEAPAAMAQGTPTAQPVGGVSGVTLGVDAAASSGPCPHTFQFTGQLSLTKAASVTYLLEVTDGLGASVKTPLPATRNLGAGTHPIAYEMTYQTDFSGAARLHITSPVDLASNQVNFSLTCG